MSPLISIVGCATDARQAELNLVHPDRARQAAEEMGRALAQAGCRILVYSSSPDFIEFDVVRGFMSAAGGRTDSVQVRYPLSCSLDPFPNQEQNEALFDWHPDRSNDWEVAFYRSLEEVDGMLLIGGGSSTLISGLVAMGHRIPIVALAAFGGAAAKAWEALSVERDLATGQDILLMARPKWTSDSAKELVAALLGQRARLQEEKKMLRLEELRKSGVLRRHAILAILLFVVALVAVPVAWGDFVRYRWLLFLLFFSPMLGGVSGATIRMVFDCRQKATPLAPHSALITGALGLIAGGVSGLLFISAQLSALPAGTDEVVARLQEAQASRLVPFAVSIGFIAGLTLDMVFRKLTGIDVVHSEVVEVKQG